MVWTCEGLMDILLDYREIIGDERVEEILSLMNEDISFIEDFNEINYQLNYTMDFDNFEDKPLIMRVMKMFYLITWVKYDDFTNYIQGFRHRYKWVMDTFIDKETTKNLDCILNYIKIVHEDLKILKIKL